MALRLPPSRMPGHSDEGYTIPRARVPADPGFDDPSASRRTDLRRGVSIRLSLYKKIAVTFIILVVLLLAFVLYLAFVRATVIIVPRAEAITGDFEIRVEEEPSAEMVIPGHVLETVVDGQKTVAVIPGENVKTVEGTACGMVTIINNRTTDQPLVVRTRLLSPGDVLFRIQETINIPAGGTIETRACADQPGVSGDIGPTRFTIPGLNPSSQKLVYAESKETMTGGLSKIAVLSEEDITKASEAFAKELADQALLQLKEMLPAEDGATGSVVTSNVVKKETDKKAGDEASEFTLSLSVHITGVFYDQDTLGQVVVSALRSQVSADREVQSINTQGMNIALVEADAVAKQATIKVSIFGTAVVRQTALMFDAGKLVSRSPEEAKQYLESLPAVESATIKLSPAWQPLLPKLKDHIDIVIEEPSGM